VSVDVAHNNHDAASIISPTRAVCLLYAWGCSALLPLKMSSFYKSVSLVARRHRARPPDPRPAVSVSGHAITTAGFGIVIIHNFHDLALPATT